MLPSFNSLWVSLRNTFIEEVTRQRRMERPDPLSTSYQAAMSRPPTQQDARHLISQLKLINPVRYARVRRDMAWIRRELIRMGVDPERARWLV